MATILYGDDLLASLTSDALARWPTRLVLGLPNAFWLAAVILVCGFLLTGFAQLGRGILAIGNNEPMAVVNGIPVARIKIAAFMIAGLLSALAGVLATIELGSGSPGGGAGQLFTVIPAAVISFVDWQMAEIARAVCIDPLAGGSPLIVLDEPTAVLEHKETAVLEREIRNLKAFASVIFVSHRLDEILRICDRVIVMRSGQLILDRSTQDVTKEELFPAMAGRVSRAVHGRRARIGVVVALLCWAMLRYTGVGQGMTAMGKNEPGAIFSAVRTRWLKVLAFAISGFTGALAGISVVAQAGSASASGLGSDLLLPGIAAALVGGTAISGGLTNPCNVVFGALTVAFVPIAVQAIGISAQAQSLVYGFFVIVIVVLTTSRSRDAIIK